MTNQRIHSITTSIVVAYFTAITIIEFIQFDNQTWRGIACFFLFPLLALLITVSVAGFIFSPCMCTHSKASTTYTFLIMETPHQDANEATEDTEQSDKEEQTS